MRGKTFVVLCISVLLLSSASYFFAVDRIAIPSRTVDGSFKQFMLKATESIPGRVIISSGSNSALGIDDVLMERYLGRLVINLADNGTFPLEHKIYNLRNYLADGDILIFPLEWQYYNRSDKMGDFYVKSVVERKGRYSFYYKELPLYNRLGFVFNHVPFSLALQNILGMNAFSMFNSELRQSEARSLGKIYNSINDGTRGSILDDRRLDPGDNGSATLSCDQYILGKAESFKVSERFKRNLRLLKEVVQETNVKAFFAWPVVVGKTGNECYTSDFVVNNIGPYTDEIVDTVSSYGFSFIGSIYDSRFDSSCFRDTYYHIRHRCARKRTMRLIRQLENHGVTLGTGYSYYGIENKLSRYAAEEESAFFGSLDVTRVNVPFERSGLTKYLLLIGGWSKQEKWGVWSIGKRSEIIVPKTNSTFNAIHFKGRYFDGDEKTKVFINYKFVGEFVLTDKVVDLNGSFSGERILVTLEHTNPISPSDLGRGGDERKIKYGLNSIELINNRQERVVAKN